jgi:heat shock protein HslJ
VRTACFAASMTLLVTGCSSLPVAQPGASLAGTSWQLHAIQSMDDAQGTTHVPDPQRFTLRFDTNGRVSLQLDCNRGTGTWEVVASGADSGSLKFGPIATTRAMCPPPHLDQRVARDLPYVRGYRLKEGKLFMSLMADGGIYEWWPSRP